MNRALVWILVVAGVVVRHAARHAETLLRIRGGGSVGHRTRPAAVSAMSTSAGVRR